MPGPHRLFGIEPALATMALCGRWITAGYPRSDPVFLGGIEALVAHSRRLHVYALDPKGAVLRKVLEFLQNVPERDRKLETLQALPQYLTSADAASSFMALAMARRSVREFKPNPVPDEILLRAVQAALIMLLAMGYETEGCMVPRSPRRGIDDALQII